MKRVNNLLIAAFVAASSMFVVSCGEDEFEAPEVSISYSYQKGSQTISGTAVKGGEVKSDDLIEGTSINFKVKFKKGSEKMNNILVESKLDGANNTYKIIELTGLADGVFNFRGGNELDTVFSTNVGKVKETFTFTIEDKGTGSDVFTLTVIPFIPTPVAPPAGEQYSYIRKGATTLGAQKDPTNPSFYSVADAKTMNLSTARSNQGKVNLAFFYSGGAGVGNPGSGNSSVVNGITYGSTANTTTSWSCAATTLAKVSSSTTLNDAWWKSGQDLLNNGGAKEVTSLAVNDAVFFRVGTTDYVFIVVTAPSSESGSFVVQFVDRTDSR